MDLKKLYQDVVDGNAPEVQAGVKAALEAGIGAEEILGSGLIAAMAEVGQRYEEGDLFVPEMLIAARAMQAGLHILKPYLAKDDVKSAGIVAIGTVKGDLHDIGKNLVAMMLEGSGYEVRDLGVDVAPDAFVKAAQEGAQLIGMSALMTTTMSNMEVTVQALKAAGLRDSGKVFIGGAPVTQDY
ncbi:MAG: corrinoid protein, partial [Chloroflexi bacterium]|nr:corrinoid protein [Chloroflexota bacterium]